MNEGRWAAAVAIGSRLLLMAVAVVTAAVIGVRSRALFLRDPAHAEVLEGFAKRLFEPWAHWDGVWFVRIAADGYAAYDFSPAFFPLYPLMMRVLAPLTAANYVIAGVLISLACYAAAMLLLYRLARAELGARVALWSVVFISLFPTALVFQAVYSESLFLLLAISCFAAARRGNWLWAGVAGLLATLTRSSGLALLLPLAVMWWEQRHALALRLPGGPARAKVQPRRPAFGTLAYLLLIPGGLALYMAYLWRVFGDPWRFGVVQGNWGRGLSAPWSAAWNGAVEGVRGIGWLVVHGPGEILGRATCRAASPSRPSPTCSSSPACSWLWSCSSPAGASCRRSTRPTRWPPSCSRSSTQPRGARSLACRASSSSTSRCSSGSRRCSYSTVASAGASPP